MNMSAAPQPATVPSVTSDEPSDEALMLRYCEGDADAFAVLYGRHKGSLYRYFLRQCDGAAVAEELFQDVWFNLIRARTQYTVQAKFSTYLYRLAHNRLVDYYRRQSAALVTAWNDGAGPPIEDAPSANEKEPEQQMQIRSQVTRLLNLLQALPE